jgi:hypothetical protein
MAITAADIQEAVRDEVFSAGVTDRPFVAQINGAILDSDTTITMDDGTPWAPQDIGEFDDGEQVLVVSVSTNDLTVIRGWNGTTAAAQSDNAILTQNPRFTRKQIDQALQHMLEDLRPTLYDLETKTLTYDPTTTWYEFSAADDARIINVVSVYYKASGVDHPYPVEFYRFQREVDSTAFSGARGISMPAQLHLATGSSVYVLVRKEVQTISDCPDNWKSMLIMGVVYHLLGGANVARTQDPGKRTDRTVQAGQEGRDSLWYLREYVRRRDRLQADLADREHEVPRSRIAMRAARFRR